MLHIMAAESQQCPRSLVQASKRYSLVIALHRFHGVGISFQDGL